MQADWELSQQFISDSQGVRASCPLSSSNKDLDEFMLVTGNQGGGLCEFGITSGSLNPISFQHNHSVTTLLSTPLEEDNQIYITGCKDAMIRIFSRQHELISTLKGHEKTVSSLAFASTSDTSKRFLVSGSWDGTAKVWDLERHCVIATLPGHENTVSVCGLLSDNPNYLKIATGSAGIAQGNVISGHTVRIWSVDVKTCEVSCLKSVANDHEGPIRNILQVNDACLATCSNDGTVKLRSPDTGTALQTLQFVPQQQSHPPMLLSIAKAGGDESIVASAEDGHVVVFNLSGAGEPQILLHPACVWNVIDLPNGDIATCCDDGTLRVFTRNSDRMAPMEERETYAQLVQEAHQKKGSGPTPEEIAKLPLWEQNLQVRGNSEGQVHVFNKGGVAIAAQWSAASQTWIEVGQVMGNAGDGGAIDGVQYDHVYPIEVDQTGGAVAKLQIGYNNGENPFVAAQRFIDAYMLPQHHLNDIANYIQQRAGSAAPSLGGGGGAPSQGGSSSVAATTGIPMVSYQHLPMPGYKSFELSAKSAATTMEKMQAKIKGFGKLSEEQLEQIASLANTLMATNRYHASQIQPAELNAISNMLETLPPSEAFPALDLARLTVAHPHGAAENNAAYWSKVVAKALSMCQDTSSLEGPAAVAIPMLSLRLCSNAFRGGPGSQLAVVGHLDAILTIVDSLVASSNKNVRLSVATLLYNIAYYIHSKASSDSTTASRVIMCCDAVLKARTYEAEAIIRVLIAAGTVSLANAQAKETAKSIFMVSRVEMSASPHGDVAKAVAKEVYNAMQ